MKDLEHVCSHLLQAETKACQHPRAYALSLPEQSQEEVFGSDVEMVEALRFIDG